MPIYLDSNAETPTTELGNNRRIQIKIHPTSFGVFGEDGEQLAAQDQFVFYTHAEPICASVEYILLNGGEIIESLPEAAIYLMSFANSTMVEDMLLYDPSTLTGEHATFYNRAKAEFTKCKTVADLLRAVISSRGTSIGRKSLADFSIDTSAMGNLLTQARGYLGEFVDCYKWWQTVLYSGGAADHMFPGPQSAVKAGYNPNTAGIGRGWLEGGLTLDQKEIPQQVGDTWHRVRRYGSAHPGKGGSNPHHHNHLQNRAHCDPDVGD